MSNLVERTAITIAAEINSIKAQTRQILLFNSIEIGRRLIEAKELVGHGEWGNWLQDSVDYSQRTASNLMRIFEEYGSTQLTLLGDNSNSQALANLSYTQAVALLGVPSDEREIFIKENEIDNMSTRQLNEAIKARDNAIKEKEKLEKRLSEAESEIETGRQSKESLTQNLKFLEEANENSKLEVNKLRNEVEKLTEEIKFDTDDDMKSMYEEANKNYCESQKKIAELEQKLKEVKAKQSKNKAEEKIVEVIPKEIEEELRVLREKSLNAETSAKYAILFNSITMEFGEMLEILDDMDVETSQKYKTATCTLLNKMLENM